jgi:DNA-binding winged helix-turn-helix (wHTH) protein
LDQAHRGTSSAAIGDEDVEMDAHVRQWLAEHGMKTIPAVTSASPEPAEANPRPNAQRRTRAAFQPDPEGTEGPDARGIGAGLAWSGSRLDGAGVSLGRRKIRIGPLDIDPARRTVRVDRAEAHLTPTEFRLLCHLAENSERVVSHRELLDRVWGPGHENDVHLLHVTMRTLRTRISAVTDRVIAETVYGSGYRLADLGEASGPGEAFANRAIDGSVVRIRAGVGAAAPSATHPDRPSFHSRDD